MPRMRNYFTLSFAIGLFSLILDGNYRAQSILHYMSPLLFLKNTAFTVIALFLLFTFVALAIYGIERLWILTLNRLGKGSKYREGSCSNFLFYAVFVYANLVYFKYFIASFTLQGDLVDPLARERNITVVVGFFFILLYFLYMKKRDQPLLLSTVSQGWCAFSFSIIGFCGIVLLITLLCTVLSKVQRHGSSTGADAARKPTIILVTCDSLSSMHMSLYGYHRTTMPYFSQSAREFYVFKRMIANSNWTYTSLPCLLGRYPRDFNYPYSNTNIAKAPSLITVLKNNGYKTRCFISEHDPYRSFRTNFTLCMSIKRFHRTALARMLYGIFAVNDLQWLSSALSEKLSFFDILSTVNPRDVEQRSDPCLLPYFFDTALQMLRENPSPAFIWIHTFESHSPYMVPPGFPRRYGKNLVDHYDDCISFLDSELHVFVERLKKEGYFDSSLFILGSDHGEAFGLKPHARTYRFGHAGDTLNDEINDIPLAIHLPGQRVGKSIETFACQVDVAPTILELLDIPRESWMEGESLVKYMQDGKLRSNELKFVIPVTHFMRKYLPMEKNTIYFISSNADMFNVYWDRYKIGWVQLYSADPARPAMINQVRQWGYYCIFDVVNDPQERDNLLYTMKSDDLLRRIFESPIAGLYKGDLKSYVNYAK